QLYPLLVGWADRSAHAGVRAWPARVASRGRRRVVLRLGFAGHLVGAGGLRHHGAGQAAGRRRGVPGHRRRGVRLMKAFTTLGDGIAALQWGERPTPRPGRDEVLVKMTAAGLNFRDLLVINGTGPWKPHAPRIPVSDGVGVVVAVGEAV